ncbi:hypothetical protein ZIOFF_069551 [Zingiber officinale]|uniref:Major facilitator superfamily (MFS) profile domain-containing protein n=1 Tax=Zingiber officinale TaxID=94328 RepID=A0A8J5BH81_ZINOF|nr:hypothetical protein ZIOFF_069551 [Zingiber officinale]
MEVKEEGETGKPLMERKREKASASPSIWMVVASTAVAVSGSFEFGMSVHVSSNASKNPLNRMLKKNRGVARKLVGYSSPSQSGIMHDLNLSLPQYSLFGSILTIGAMIGAIFSGRVADLIGRKSAMAVSDFLCITGWTFIFLTKGIWLLDIGRLLIGCGIGLLSYVVPVYIAEITPKSLRGGFAAVNQLMICCGGSLAYLFGTVFTWRILAIIVSTNSLHFSHLMNALGLQPHFFPNKCILKLIDLIFSASGTFPCFLQLMSLFFIPESPRWLAMVGSHQEFVAVLKRLRGKHSDVSQEAEEIMEFTVSLQRLPQSSMVDLFQKIYLHAVIVGVGLMILQQFGGVNAIHFYASEIFVSAGKVLMSLQTIIVNLTILPHPRQ